MMHLAVAVAAIIAAWTLCGARAALIAFASALAYTLLFLRTTRARYRAIAELSDSIDRVLHDPENEANIAAVRKDVNALMADYPLFAW